MALLQRMAPTLLRPLPPSHSCVLIHERLMWTTWLLQPTGQQPKAWRNRHESVVSQRQISSAAPSAATIAKA